MRKEHAYPIPEAVDGEEWTVQEGGQQGWTDYKTRTMRVPTATVDCIYCGADHAGAVRTHEMGHVTWTPTDWDERAKTLGLPLDLVDAVEDGRLNLRRGNDTVLRPDPLMCAQDLERIVGLLASRKDWRGLLGTGMAASFTEQEANVWEEALDAALQPREAMRDGERVEVPPALTPVHVATISDAVSRAREMLVRDAHYSGTLAATEFLVGKLDDIANKDELQLLATLGDDGDPADGGGKDLITPEALGELADMLGDSQAWTEPAGRMTIQTPPLVRRAPAHKRTTARDEGPIPVAFHRWSVDRRVFTRKVRRKGMVVLVDCSGSMHWDGSDLDKLLAVVPAATVAFYSGNGRQGILRIVARGGKRVAAELASQPDGYGANVIDVPALEWLATQDADRRIWVCDGIVTGQGDAYLDADGITACVRSLRRGKVEQVPSNSIDDVLDVVRGRRKVRWQDSFVYAWGDSGARFVTANGRVLESRPTEGWAMDFEGMDA